MHATRDASVSLTLEHFGWYQGSGECGWFEGSLLFFVRDVRRKLHREIDHGNRKVIMGACPLRYSDRPARHFHCQGCERHFLGIAP